MKVIVKLFNSYSEEYEKETIEVKPEATFGDLWEDIDKFPGAHGNVLWVPSARQYFKKAEEVDNKKRSKDVGVTDGCKMQIYRAVFTGEVDSQKNMKKDTLGDP